ncbi:DNA-directed RNA polymerase sigma-70 factor [Emticicia aquatilis]|uniref:DNA-directed RNA polymerase sigma-70 factor n=1 Tax=Emticicia aquatilis TaxID=1537369 RepID=A0A916YY08_9BACT|nr:sigma-70 family RNA polymerase sigma factor [Emticicia aquatilis]GGD66683.1 DNA-directed RNA polymerase sigma-70 factor [Emticicia aquatilis]
MEYKILSDELLVKLLRVGEQDAFEEIYRRYWQKLLRSAQFKLRSKETIEEILQDLFISLWEKREKVLIENLEAYLNTSLRYLIINQIKKQILQEKFVEYSLKKNELTDDVDESVAFNELSVAIEKAIEQLPEKTQQIFRLNRLEYKSVKEISVLLETPERTVEYHITQALKALRIHLREFITLSVVLSLRIFGFLEN